MKEYFMKLVIVESPAKAKTIEKFLGRTYKVVASVGHVIDLPKSKMGIDIEHHFEPKYINIRGKGDVIKNLRKHAKKADKIFLATDPDREGEAIAWHLSHLLNIPEDEPCRVVFREITKDAIKQAMKNPRTINIPLVDAQQSRRVLDRLVGYSISPILWRKVQKGLSAGRVQSVATKLICDRERSITAFQPEEYWTLSACTDVKSLCLDYYGEKKKRVPASEQEVDEIIASCGKQQLQIQTVTKKEKQRLPQLPFTTSSLQQEASNRLGFGTKKTMMLAQQLYEGIAVKGNGTVGLITYMRTDSTRISSEATEAATAYVSRTYGTSFLGKAKKKAASKNSQDAHEAIRPTNVEYTPDQMKENLSKDQHKLYDLIWSRFIASNMAAAKYQATSVEANVGSHIFKKSGSVIIFPGYQVVYAPINQKNNELPNLEESMKLNVKKYEKEQHFTQPPARYTEASLVKEMEENGIGRPSTYAPTISTILYRGYVTKEKKSLVPTELGFIIDEIMGDYFQPIVNVEFTANMEKKFDEIEAGGVHWKDSIAEFYKGFEPLLHKAENEIEKRDVTEETDMDCPKCGSKILIRTGRYGKFYSCSAYPDCDYTKPILKEVGMNCPKCQNGRVVVRKTKKMRVFYGCSEFPNCDFVSWDLPTEQKCPKCGEILYKKKNKLVCHHSECKYTISVDE